MRKIIVSCIFVFALFFNISAQINEARKLYEFTGRENCEEAKLQIDKFALELQKLPKATAYILYYGGRGKSFYDSKTGKEEIILPQRNEAKAKIIGFINDYLVETRIGRKIKLIDGGYRENYTVQFWIVPEGAELPKPTPTIKSEDIKFRKGKYRHRQGEGC